MSTRLGFKVIRHGVYEPEGYEPPTRTLDDKRLKEIVQQILSTKAEAESGDESEAAAVDPEAKTATP
jgi:hypothetical protein